MAGASTSVCEFDNEVRGQHVYKSAWTPLTDKTHKCILLEDNERDKYVAKQSIVSASKRRMHTSREISRIS